MMLALVAMTGQAKDVVWEQPTIEYGTSNGDGFFNLALDLTKVELKGNETVVYITARQRPGSERDDYWFQFAGDTYLKVGDQRVTSGSGYFVTLCSPDNRKPDACHPLQLPDACSKILGRS